MNAVEIQDLRKEYDGRCVLHVPALALARGEFFVLVGPSGSGKTTLLRILAGLIRPDAGTVAFDGSDMAGRAPHERGIGVVFQGLALWPHLTVRGNLSLGLARIVPSAAERARRIGEAAAELGIADHLDRKPALLSGGEQQRVALARALVRRPSLLLLDEPFSDLDARLRRSIARLVRQLHDRHGMTTLLITHDRTDAHLLADRIGVLRDGALVACDRPDRLHATPTTAFAAEFLSDATILSGEADGENVRTVLGRLPLATAATGLIHVAVRPDEVRVGPGGIAGTVVACEFAGGPWRCRVDVGGTVVAGLCDEQKKNGDAVRLRPPTTPRHVLGEDR